ncbi:MAG: uracil-DNA glycosylase family protein [Halobacteriales archaeon]
MDAKQDSLRNPLGLDEACPNCPALVERRERVIHGYGDVGADVLVVGEAPTAGAEGTAVPFTGDETGRGVHALLADLGLSSSLPTADHPEVENVYLTYLARCRHPDRPPSDGEIATCDPFLNAEVRMINPEILLPVGERALEVLAAEHTTLGTPPDIGDAHATEIRGRGFLLVPMRDPADQTDAEEQALRETMASLLGGDYRQSKGRRGQQERKERSRREMGSDTGTDR